MLVKRKLDTIATVWNHYICNYKFFRKALNLNQNNNIIYFGDILNYFSDTFKILNKKNQSSNFTEHFESSIAFLQAIYLQQDFVEELHFIFKTGCVKGDLKKDENYSINREIRNELIGHPIRKILIPKEKENIQIEKCQTCGMSKNVVSNQKVLLSSTLFSYQINVNYIVYVKYDRKKDFRFHEVKHEKSEILRRHYLFLDKNFDKILRKLKLILRKFLKQTNDILNNKSNIPFENLIKILSNSFEHIMTLDYLFKPDILISISKKQDEHKRYRLAYDYFLNSLDIFLNELKKNINEIVEDDCVNNDKLVKNINIITPFTNEKEEQSKLNQINNSDNNLIVENHCNKKKAELNSKKTVVIKPNINKSNSFQYELSKLHEKSDKESLKLTISLLKIKCKDKPIVLLEIEQMLNNLDNDLEYYSALLYVERILNEKKNHH